MALARKIVFYSSTALIVLLFAFTGLVKLTPLVGSEVHHELVRHAASQVVATVASEGEYYL